MNKSIIITLFIFAFAQAVNTNIGFDINGTNENYCVRYSEYQQGTCIAIGDLSNDSFDVLNSIADGRLKKINNCRAYTNDGHCEHCIPEFAYNGKSCERCTKSTRIISSALSCDYNWRAQIKGRCRRTLSLKTNDYERCLRRQRFPRMTAPFWRGAPTGRVWVWMGSRWGTTRSMNGDCDATKSPAICNCLSSFHRDTCGKCKPGFTLQGHHHNTLSWANKNEHGEKEFTGYHCVKNTSIKRKIVTNCQILSPKDDFGGVNTCIQCNYQHGFRMTSDYSCTEQDLNDL